MTTKTLKLLAERYRAGLKRAEGGRKEWIEGVLDMATTLAEAREQFPANQAFKEWLEEHNLHEVHNDHERAALIGMGQNLDLARSVLQETERNSLRYIWEDEMQP